MKKILYVSAHNPYPARSGGQVDLWNRLHALRELGHCVHLVLTVKRRLSAEERSTVGAVVDRLTEIPRKPLLRGVLSRLPVQMAVRSGLRRLDLSGERYDLLLLDNEFAGEVLENPAISAARVAIRVHNDEAAYQRKLAEAADGMLRRWYFRLEAARMARYLPRVWRRADALWFISSDELAGYNAWAAGQSGRTPGGRMLPAALDLGSAGKPPLGTMDVLFVGSLAVTLNQDAVRWYLEEVHPRLLDLAGYRFLVAGSTLGQNLDNFCAEVSRSPAVKLHRDVPELSPLFAASSVFVSPMRHGAGVKLKTVEAVLRGLPLVSTPVGTEGSGLQNGVHARITADPVQFAEAVRALLKDKAAAESMRDRAAEHILRSYNHAEHLNNALAALDMAG